MLLSCLFNYSYLSTELEGSAVQMMELYCKNLPLSKDLDPQENMHGEELLSMVCNVLIQVSLTHCTSKNSFALDLEDSIRCFIKLYMSVFNYRKCPQLTWGLGYFLFLFF